MAEKDFRFVVAKVVKNDDGSETFHYLTIDGCNFYPSSDFTSVKQYKTFDRAWRCACRLVDNHVCHQTTVQRIYNNKIVPPSLEV